MYHSIDTVADVDDVAENLYTQEFLNSLKCQELPDHEIKIKPNAIFYLTRNLRITEGLCNGQRFRALEVLPYVIKAEIVGGLRDKQIVCIPRIVLYSDEKTFPFRLKRKQFPIRLAFAMTINKSQGQTFDKVGLHLEKECFAHGQLYVGMSLVTSYPGLKIFVGLEKGNNLIRNVVYKEILDPDINVIDNTIDGIMLRI